MEEVEDAFDVGFGEVLATQESDPAVGEGLLMGSEQEQWVLLALAQSAGLLGKLKRLRPQGFRVVWVVKNPCVPVGCLLSLLLLAPSALLSPSNPFPRRHASCTCLFGLPRPELVELLLACRHVVSDSKYINLGDLISVRQERDGGFF
ncbi:hypothetical protein PGT21_020478 [Puccinia graminis f. sp. tritici]|uniref:Uncharacterized protein n=1 Tax=Puccinia graminis f. sp. tritici TaxID=56615 RepID=A0A5B0RS33_PUCGR|nr:hypothetical protein PGT21_020478 [Puccinia graminis f. sp. tritici]KAA1127663.1 hypothetical protein PGTUg99_004610 [Puccinia graminis f. sp. tritici]KAA1129755.1 hypothetical protein PGTUg99_036340 [Puccinia graminis f. sp. tritici]